MDCGEFGFQGHGEGFGESATVGRFLDFSLSFPPPFLPLFFFSFNLRKVVGIED